MKILHLNSYYNGSPFYKNIFDFQRRGNDVCVYVHMSSKDINSIKDENCTISKPYGNIEKFIYFTKHRKIWKDLKVKTILNNFDCVHAHSLFSNGYEAYKVFKTFGIPYLVSVRNTDLNVFFKYCIHLRPLGLKILLNSKKIVFISPAYRDYLVSRFIPSRYKKQILEKAIVIPNGVDAFWLNNCSQHNKDASLIRVISVGTVEKNKNQLTTCLALDRIKKQGKNVEFRVVGKIKDKKYFAKVRKFSFVAYQEALPKSMLIEEYRKSDIFVMPSYTETFGLVYAEAMSQGLPIIYSKGQGFDGQYEEGEVGFSTNPSNYFEIADKIIKCYDEYNDLSIKAKTYSIRYRWNDINKKILEIYQEVSYGHQS